MKLSAAQPASAQQPRPAAARPLACQCPRVLQHQARVLVTVNSMWSASPEARRQHVEELQQQCSRAGWMAASVLPLAAMRAVVQPGGTGEIYFALAKAMDIYLVILTVRVLLTWFRNISWYNEPFNTLKQFTDPYLNLFRGIIPPIGGIDLSTMLGFFALQLASGQLKRLAYTC